MERTEKANFNLDFLKFASLTFGRLNNRKVVEPGIVEARMVVQGVVLEVRGKYINMRRKAFFHRFEIYEIRIEVNDASFVFEDPAPELESQF